MADAPGDPEAASIWEGIIAPLLNDRTNVGKVDGKRLEAVLDAAKSQSYEQRMAAAYALALSDTPESDSELLRLTGDKQDGVNFTAEFGIMLKRALKMKPGARFGQLSSALLRSHNELQRFYCVNWLAYEYGKEAIPLFRRALRDTPHGFARHEMYYQILMQGGNADLLAVLKGLENDCADYHRRLAEMNSPFSVGPREVILLSALSPEGRIDLKMSWHVYESQYGGWDPLLERYKEKIAALPGNPQGSPAPKGISGNLAIALGVGSLAIVLLAVLAIRRRKRRRA
jgi:hypothetical protein